MDKAKGGNKAVVINILETQLGTSGELAQQIDDYYMGKIREIFEWFDNMLEPSEEYGYYIVLEKDYQGIKQRYLGGE